MIGMSAAKATDDNKDAAPAAKKYLTLRIGSALFSGKAAIGGPTSKLTGERWQEMLKRHLTLIFKVDNS
jgi:hypothetical protein